MTTTPKSYATLIRHVARAFARRRNARVGNAESRDGRYYLFGHCIAQRMHDGSVIGDWCGYYTQSTARHLNLIASELGPRAARVSYAAARDAQTERFVLWHGEANTNEGA